MLITRCLLMPNQPSAAPIQPEDVFTLTGVHQNVAFSCSDHIVLLTFDDNYLDQSINLILSIARHNPRGVSFICICPQLKEESIGALLALVQGIQVRCYRFSLDFQMGRWALSAILRLFCPWLLDASIHTVLYMDSDILCTGVAVNFRGAVGAYGFLPGCGNVAFDFAAHSNIRKLKCKNIFKAAGA